MDEVPTGDLAARQAQGAIRVGIRDPQEHAAGHIPGSVAISSGKLELTVKGLIPDPEATVICYCDAYNHGALSAATLRDMGYRNARFIGRGLNAWEKLG